MEILLRLLLIFVKFVAFIAYGLLNACLWVRGNRPMVGGLPPIRNPLLLLSIQELRRRLRSRQLTSMDLLAAYIERIRAVNCKLNALVEARFEAALREAYSVDELIATAAARGEVEQLFARQPLLGLPFSVKESCALAGKSFAVASLARRRRRAAQDGVVVARIRAAGAIPLLVSATPEYCYSTDTDTLVNGRCLNPFDFDHTPGGSSGGEGALNGAGASLFGIGSDIAGSIRIPSFFCGVFGHKPTGGVVTPTGHFPDSIDPEFRQYLVLGPMTRFAVDLAQLVELMAGPCATRLRLHEPVKLNQLKVHYALGFEGLNGAMHQAVDEDIKTSIRKAVEHLKALGLSVQETELPTFSNSLEISLCGIARLANMPYVLDIPMAAKWVGASAKRKVCDTLVHLLRSVLGRSPCTTNALIFDLMRRTNAFMPIQRMDRYRREALYLTNQLTQLLGTHGVLLFPTMHAPASRHGWTPLQLWGVDYTLLFNILGMPATHVPMGLNKKGLPIGFSVIAAPYQDRLCLRLAVELERAFGGWQQPYDSD